MGHNQNEKANTRNGSRGSDERNLVLSEAETEARAGISTQATSIAAWCRGMWEANERTIHCLLLLLQQHKN